MYKQMKRTLTEYVLKILQTGVEAHINLFRTHRGLFDGQDFAFERDWADAYGENRRFRNFLGYLRDEGLVSSRKKPDGLLWRITTKGKKKLKILEVRNHMAGLGERSKPIVSSVIVSYDIPEEFRHERNWVRSVLKTADFTMVQRSVWIGKRRLPEEFFSLLKERGLLETIHVFEVGKHGTLRRSGL